MRYADALAWPDKDQTAQLAFTEERNFPFRKFPKRYAGNMFRAPNGELAICYESPHAFRLVIQGDAILLDDGDGQLRPLPTDGADARVVSDLLRGDLGRLRADWTNEPIDDGLRLTPTLESIRKEIKYIDVTFADGRVQTVTVNQRNQAIRRYEFGALTWLTGDTAALPFAE
ncbi:hypothetical protein [Cerasicoccus arenae]|uniref:Outer membrane lipoprotein carrier protein LolA n=1 Tax=Cerasicoccus arenae TaxID=424488 RepID=A0A8J3D6T0_9BACT|nr:hypothetical protein [Cerasicoccus arenae]MBK1858323.1 hypothetical protein [Cerasicoccus arenae]GHB90772.1 hypothetical protein GCM10007047_01990 [Cerasicoccus arenae]